MKYTFPNDTYGQNVVLMQIDIALLPLIVGNIKHLTREHIWIDTNSWRSGYNAIAEMLLMQNGIVEAIDRLYRLVDTSFNGTQYSAVDGLVSPELPAVPPASVDAANSMRAHLGRLWHLAENEVAGVAAPAGAGVAGSVELSDLLSTRAVLREMQGQLPSGLPFGWGDKPATLADLVRALRNDSSGEQNRTDTALQALAAAAQGATIFDIVRGFLQDGASNVAEGGILIATLIGIMGNTAMQRIQLEAMLTTRDRLDRLISSLDGGGTPAPTYNILSQLQSTYGNVTLAQLLSAIQAGSASGGATEATLAGIAAAIGTRADCSLGESVVGLLCRLNNAVESIPAPNAPSVVCPGFSSTAPFFQVVSWPEMTSAAGGTGVFCASLAGVSPEMYIQPGQYIYLASDPLTVVSSFRVTAQVDLCFRVDLYQESQPNTSYEVIRFIAEGGYQQIIPITSGGEPGNNGDTFYPGYDYAVRAVSYDSVAPNVALFVIRGQVVM